MRDRHNIYGQTFLFEGNRPASPPAYFLSLTVENIRCFGPKQVLDLSDGNGRPASWTIILGDNGFGKTTLLQCLSGLQPIVRNHPVRKNGQVLSPIFTMSAELQLYFINKLVRLYPSTVECSVFYGSNLREGDKGKVFKDLGMSADPFNITVNAADYTENGDEIEDISGLVCFGYGATRRMGSGSLSGESEHSFINGLFSDNASLINAEEWYLQTDYSSHRDPSGKVESQQLHVKDALIQLLPDVTDIRIRRSETGFQVEVKTPFDWVHIQNLSLGYRTLIAWVVDLAHRLFERYPNSKNPLAEPAVVLVDEIDLHLHPRFQRTLMDYLTNLFPNTQFIATAHSPLVVQAASNANIALLRREGDHIVIDNDVEAIANWRIDQVLTSDLFGFESARPPQYDDKLKERTQILSKARLTKADRARLKELEDEIGDLPTGETPDDIKAMDIIRQAAQQLTNGQRK